MADQLNTTTNLATGPGLSSVTSTLQGTLNSITTKATSLLNRIIPPSTRSSLQSKATTFATERPLLATFLLSHIALSALPLALFLIMSLTVVIFALLTGILVGVLGAVVFIVFAVGFALLILLPTLFVTTFFACAVWLWGVGAYYILKWFNEESIPGVHGPLGQGLKEKIGLGGLLGGNGDEDGDRKTGSNGVERNEEKREMNGANSTKADHPSNEKKDETHHHHEEHKKNVPSQKKTKVKERDEDQAVKKIAPKKLGDAADEVTNLGKNVASVAA